MNLENLFVREKKEFNELEEMVNATFNIDSRLPEQVFHQQFGHFKFEEFDWAMGKDFWCTIQKLANETKDDFVLTAVLDPSPVEYFNKEFNYYNWMKLPIELAADNYSDILELGPEESPADAVMYNSYTVIWLSPSMKWAIWGDRNYGVCVIGFRDISNRKKLLPFLKTWHSIDETVLSWIEPNFVSQLLPQKIVKTLFFNYQKIK